MIAFSFIIEIKMFFFKGNVFFVGTLEQYADLRGGFENWTSHHCPINKEFRLERK